MNEVFLQFFIVHSGWWPSLENCLGEVHWMMNPWFYLRLQWSLNLQFGKNPLIGTDMKGILETLLDVMKGCVSLKDNVAVNRIVFNLWLWLWCINTVLDNKESQVEVSFDQLILSQIPSSMWWHLFKKSPYVSNIKITRQKF